VAIKIKRKVARPEGESHDPNDITAPDQVLVTTRETFSWMTENRNLVIAGVAGLVLLVIAGSVYLQGGDKRRAAASAPLFAALNVAVTEAGSAQTYTSVTAREEALLAATQEGRPDHVLSSLLAGRASLALGQADQALASYRAAADGLGDGPEVFVAQIGIASSQAAAGDVAGALIVLDEVATNAPRFAFAAKLHGARLVDTYGDASAALEAYRALAQEFSDRTDLDMVTYRVSQLELALNATPAPNGEEGAGADSP